MMIALIDFMLNRYKFASVNLQCATIMRSVYPVPNMFDGIEEFLDNGRLSFAMFLEKHKTRVGAQIAENIAEIAAFIQPMISACARMGPPRRLGNFRLAPDTPRASPVDDLPPSKAQNASSSAAEELVVAAKEPSEEAVAPLIRSTIPAHDDAYDISSGGRRRRTLRRRFNALI
jgi:hypothetical protein